MVEAVLIPPIQEGETAKKDSRQMVMTVRACIPVDSEAYSDMFSFYSLNYSLNNTTHTFGGWGAVTLRTAYKVRRRT